MTQGKFDEFSNLCHLFSTSTNIIITHFVQISFLVLTLDWLALAMYDRVLRDDCIFGRINFHDLEFDLPHPTSTGEEVTLPHWAVGFPKIWCEEDIEQGSSQTLDSISNREDSDTFSLPENQFHCFSLQGTRLT